jgi:hypothetical protein
MTTQSSQLVAVTDFVDGKIAQIKGFCKITGNPYSVFVWHKDWMKYAKGIYSSDQCFPYLSESDRNIIVTGTINP